MEKNILIELAIYEKEVSIGQERLIKLIEAKEVDSKFASVIYQLLSAQIQLLDLRVRHIEEKTGYNIQIKKNSKE